MSNHLPQDKNPNKPGRNLRNTALGGLALTMSAGIFLPTPKAEEPPIKCTGVTLHNVEQGDTLWDILPPITTNDGETTTDKKIIHSVATAVDKAWRIESSGDASKLPYELSINPKDMPPFNEDTLRSLQTGETVAIPETCVTSANK